MLATATYVNKKNPDVWVVVDVYRMGSLLDAFGIYSNYSYLKAEGQEMNVTGTTDRISLTAVDPLYGGVFVEQSGPYLIGAIRMKEASAAKPIVEQLRKRLLRR
jgi:hypothetical protein